MNSLIMKVMKFLFIIKGNPNKLKYSTRKKMKMNITKILNSYFIKKRLLNKWLVTKY